MRKEIETYLLGWEGKKRDSEGKEGHTILSFSQNKKCKNKNKCKNRKESRDMGEGREGTGNKRKKKQNSNVQQNSNLTLSFAKHRKRKFR